MNKSKPNYRLSDDCKDCSEWGKPYLEAPNAYVCDGCRNHNAGNARHCRNCRLGKDGSCQISEHKVCTRVCDLWEGVA